MEITDVKVIPVRTPDGHLLAYASCVIGGVLKLNSIRIISGRSGGYFVKGPVRKYVDNQGNDQYAEYFHPIEPEFTKQLFRAISDVYKAKLKGREASAADSGLMAQTGAPPPKGNDEPF